MPPLKRNMEDIIAFMKSKGMKVTWHAGLIQVEHPVEMCEIYSEAERVTCDHNDAFFAILRKQMAGAK